MLLRCSGAAAPVSTRAVVLAVAPAHSSGACCLLPLEACCAAVMGGCRRRCTAVLSFSAHARKWRLLFTEWSNDCSWLAAALASHEYIYMRWKEQVGPTSLAKQGSCCLCCMLRGALHD